MLVCCLSMRFCNPNISARIARDLSNDAPKLMAMPDVSRSSTSNSAGSTVKKSYFKHSKAEGRSVSLSFLFIMFSPSSSSSADEEFLFQKLPPPAFALFCLASRCSSSQYGRPFKSSAANFHPASSPASKSAVFDLPSCPLFSILHKSKS